MAVGFIHEPVKELEVCPRKCAGDVAFNGAWSVSSVALNFGAGFVTKMISELRWRHVAVVGVALAPCTSTVSV